MPHASAFACASFPVLWNGALRPGSALMGPSVRKINQYCHVLPTWQRMQASKSLAEWDDIVMNNNGNSKWAEYVMGMCEEMERSQNPQEFQEWCRTVRTEVCPCNYIDTREGI